MEKLHTQILAENEVKEIDETKRIIWHTISREVPDRLGDIVRIGGIKTKEFKKKPGVLYGHLYRAIAPLPVIGTNVGFRIEGNRLVAGSKFLPDADTLSQGLRDLVNDLWYLNTMKPSPVGWSIGFMALVWEEIKDKEGKFLGYDFKESNLLEYSNVIIPAHQDAVNSAMAAGELRALAPVLRSMANGEDEVEVEKRFIVDLGSKVVNFTPDATLEIEPGTYTQAELQKRLEDIAARTCKATVQPVYNDGITHAPIKFITVAGVVTDVEVFAADTEEVDLAYVEKPYPNEHACRLQNPEKYDKFRRGKRKHEGKEYVIIFGRLKGEDTWEQQAFRYDKSVWTVAQAQAHCKDHGGKFEAASGKGGDCPECKPVQLDVPAGDILKTLPAELIDKLVSVLKRYLTKRAKVKELLKQITKEVNTKNGSRRT